MKLDYFYGAQVQRTIKHLIRLFSEFTIQDGFDESGKPRYRRVPCRYGDISRQAAVVLHENSENITASAPALVLNITNLSMDVKGLRAPMSEESVVSVNKKGSDGVYTDELEGHYEVSRYNPVPWTLEFTIDAFVTNQTNKFELFEQIATLFAPSVMLQLSANPMDWTSSTQVDLTGYRLSSRAQPQGTQHNLDISEFSFKTTIYLSLPTKVNRAVLIEQIVTNVGLNSIDEMVMPNVSDFKHLRYDVYTPGNHSIKVAPVNGNTYSLTLLGKYGAEFHEGMMFDWSKLFKYYSADDSSPKCFLMPALDTSVGIAGVIKLTKVPNVVEFVMDESTLPQTTGEPINRFSSFSKFSETKILVEESKTQFRTIILDQEEHYAIAPDVIAKVGDIVSFNGVSWSSSSPKEGDIIANIKDGKRYKYSYTDGWHEVIKAKYEPGFWRMGFRN